MLTLFMLLLVGGYAVAVSRAARRGRSALFLCAVFAVLLLAAAAMLLGLWYRVPSIARLTGYILGFVGPVIIVPTVLLRHQTRSGHPSTTLLPTALGGAVLGLVLGYFIVVFGFGTW